MADVTMLERANVCASMLSDQLADFTARFPWVDAAWLAAFESDMDAADGFPTDRSTQLDSRVITSDLRTAMAQGYAQLRQLAGYAALAWPDDVARQRAFGQNRWPGARAKVLELAEALELAHGMAQHPDYRPALLSKGYTQAAIDQLSALATELSERNGLQESAKADRKVRRHDRVELLNRVWERMGTLSICAQVVWANDAERAALYQPYRGVSRARKKARAATDDAAPDGADNG